MWLLHLQHRSPIVVWVDVSCMGMRGARHKSERSEHLHHQHDMMRHTSLTFLLLILTNVRACPKHLLRTEQGSNGFGVNAQSKAARVDLQCLEHSNSMKTLTRWCAPQKAPCQRANLTPVSAKSCTKLWTVQLRSDTRTDGSTSQNTNPNMRWLKVQAVVIISVVEAFYLG